MHDLSDGPFLLSTTSGPLLISSNACAWSLEPSCLYLTLSTSDLPRHVISFISSLICCFSSLFLDCLLHFFLTYLSSMWLAGLAAGHFLHFLLCLLPGDQQLQNYSLHHLDDQESDHCKGLLPLHFHCTLKLWCFPFIPKVQNGWKINDVSILNTSFRMLKNSQSFLWPSD